MEFYIIASFFGFILGLMIFTYLTPNYFDSGNPISVQINRGAPFSEVADSLYAKKIIPNKFNLKLIAFLFNAEKKIRAGRFIIPSGLNYIRLIDMLANNRFAEELVVTFPEGSRQSEIASICMHNLNIDSAKVMELSRDPVFLGSLGLDIKNLEGYLLPETYYIFSGTTPENLLRKLKSQLDKIFTSEVDAQIRRRGMDRNKILVMASIVKGESNYVPEYKSIAGVYYNRLRTGMPLQADPTIQYLLGEKRYKRLFFKNLSIDSKFNTYKYTGLPPAPINNPGRDAIMAAIYPEENNYFYFVAIGNGRHKFARTFAEHEINVRQYKQWRKSQY
jgi:UPF0755 protein